MSCPGKMVESIDNHFDFLPGAVVLLCALLILEYLQASPFWKLTVKIPLSSLFCLVGISSLSLYSSSSSPLSGSSLTLATTYSQIIVIGLIFGLLGDICLAFFSIPRMFLAGLVFFLLGHVFYVIAFAYLLFGEEEEEGKRGREITEIIVDLFPLLSSLGMLIVSERVFAYLKPYFLKKKMFTPCLAYIITITAMVIMSGYVYFHPGYKMTGKQIVVAGAVLFYISDIFVAIENFVAKSFFNRCLNLPTYYAGQFLIAFSTTLLI